MGDGADFLGDWMAKQRWYTAKGRSPKLRIKGTLEDSIDGAQLTTYLLIDEASAKPVLYQVPVASRAEPLAGLAHALIGERNGRFLYDGPHDPAYVRSLLCVIGEGRELAGHNSTARGRALSSPGRIRSSRVLLGEQSNTSIICELEGGSVPSVIAKVFRVLHHGENPDVTTQAALTSAGSHRVPTSFGSLEASWPDSGRDDGTATGHLACVQEFLPGLEDAWRVALTAAAAGQDFTERAYGLGVATAEVHATLARALPTLEAGPAEIEGAMISMRRRIASAAREVPSVAPFADRIREIYASVEKGSWPRLQRIHGDLHLGQTLSSPELGWVLLDFEGEPMRPMPERSRPDSILRDVAGMLRSFDYVAGALEHANPPVDARAWASAARKSFVDGYNATAGVDIRGQRALLDAFEIDKAVYESLYESRNRPDWLSIPMSAIDKLVSRSSAPSLET